ncbi:DEAD/DEAH box helicase family protein, partial [Chlamydia psittaci 84-8471/1]
ATTWGIRPTIWWL